MNLIAVVMKAPTSAIRFSNASSLLDYGFSNFEYRALAEENEALTSVNVDKGIVPTVNAVSESNCGAILAKGTSANIEQSIELNPNISAPIKKGDVIGKVSFTLDGEVIATSNLLADSDVNKINLISMNEKVIDKWYSLMRK